jgi:hypothetical protein
MRAVDGEAGVSARPGEGDVLVWCGSPAVLGVGERVMLDAPGPVPGTWVVTVLDAGNRRTHQTITVDIKDLIPESMT